MCIELHVKGIENAFNTIIAKKFQNLEGKRLIEVKKKKAYIIPNRQDKKETLHIVL